MSWTVRPDENDPESLRRQLEAMTLQCLKEAERAERAEQLLSDENARAWRAMERAERAEDSVRIGKGVVEQVERELDEQREAFRIVQAQAKAYRAEAEEAFDRARELEMHLHGANVRMDWLEATLDRVQGLRDEWAKYPSDFMVNSLAVRDLSEALDEGEES